MKSNVIAGFWIRFLARLIDLAIFAIFTFLIAWPNISLESSIHFKNIYNFYIWSLFSTLSLIFLFLVMPMITNGFTIGMWICRIKIVFTSTKKFKSLVNRELVFSILWICNLIILISVINHTMIDKILKKNLTKNLSVWENFRIGVYSSINSIAFVLQWIFAISIAIRKNKEGLHDKFSKTKTIFINKYEIIYKDSKKISSFKPYLIKNEIVEWIGE